MATKIRASSPGSPCLFSSSLTTNQLIDVLNLLKRFGFPQKRWHELGLNLGLHKNTLDAIEVTLRGDVSRCLTECLSQWLSKADDVDNKGGATFDSLSDALKSMNENVPADKFDQEKCNILLAIEILNTHHPLLSKSLSDPFGVAKLLQKEGVITGQVLASVESASPSVPNQREVLLSAIIVAIQSKYSLLQTFASVLCKFTSNIKLGAIIQKEYDEHFPSNNEFVYVKSEEEDTSSTRTITPSSSPTSTPTVEIPVRKSNSRRFTSIRASLARMLFKVSKAITQKSPPLIDLKSLICLFNSDLKAKLDNCCDISSVVYVIEGECSLTDIELLETVVEEFEVTEAERYIEQYKTTLEEFCHSMSLDLCLKEKFDAVDTSPSLKCEMATYVFDWRPDEKKLKDIIDILSKTSGKFVKIKYIDTGYSIVVTCSFPYSFTGALIIKLSENLELLIKNGLTKLTVGFCSIWSKQKIEVCVYMLDTVKRECNCTTTNKHTM
uniref:Death domain-containing protein n=1 Tax=Amphimedon queenslandica TaxID=400682 RepID=A0A1X7UXU6_AMPQE